MLSLESNNIRYFNLVKLPQILPVKLFPDTVISSSEVNLPSEWLNVPWRPLGKLILNNSVLLQITPCHASPQGSLPTYLAIRDGG